MGVLGGKIQNNSVLMRKSLGNRGSHLITDYLNMLVARADVSDSIKLPSCAARDSLVDCLIIFAPFATRVNRGPHRLLHTT